MGSPGRLEGKVAIITGAARGTGAATARHFVREGARVWAADLLDDLAGKLAAELGESARAVHLDVGDESSWRSVVDEVMDRDGRVDVLVNNAGVNGPSQPDSRMSFFRPGLSNSADDN